MAANGNHAGDTGSGAIDPEKFKRLFFTPVVPFLHDDPYTIDYDGYRSFIRRFSTCLLVALILMRVADITPCSAGRLPRARDRDNREPRGG